MRPHLIYAFGDRGFFESVANGKGAAGISSLDLFV